MVFFFQAEDGIRDLVRSRGLGDVYKRQVAEGCAAIFRGSRSGDYQSGCHDTENQRYADFISCFHHCQLPGYVIEFYYK